MQTTKRLICYLLTGLLISSYTLPAYAGIVGTETMIDEQAANLDRAAIIQALEREEVRNLLAAHGVAPADAKARVNALTDAEVRQLATRIEELPAGAQLAEVLLIGILVLVILEVTGITDLFNFIDPVN